MHVGRIFQEYGTDIDQARVLVECKLCLGDSWSRNVLGELAVVRVGDLVWVGIIGSQEIMQVFLYTHIYIYIYIYIYIHILAYSILFLLMVFIVYLLLLFVFYIYTFEKSFMIYLSV